MPPQRLLNSPYWNLCLRITALDLCTLVEWDKAVYLPSEHGICALHTSFAAASTKVPAVISTALNFDPQMQLICAFGKLHHALVWHNLHILLHSPVCVIQMYANAACNCADVMVIGHTGSIGREVSQTETESGSCQHSAATVQVAAWQLAKMEKHRSNLPDHSFPSFTKFVCMAHFPWRHVRMKFYPDIREGVQNEYFLFLHGKKIKQGYAIVWTKFSILSQNHLPL